MYNKKHSMIFAILVILSSSNFAYALESQDLKFPCEILFPQAGSYSNLEGQPQHYRVYGDGEELTGFCYLVSDKGFSANIDIMVGLNADRTFAGIRVVWHREAIIRAIGDFLREPSFYNQYEGKNVNDEFRVGKDIDAVTRATITNEVVARAVRDSSRQIAQAYLPKIEVSQQPKEETYVDSENITWNELVDEGSVVNVDIGGRKVTVLSLSFAYVNPPLIGITILGPSLHDDIMQKYGTKQLFFVGIAGKYDYLFDPANIVIEQGENRIPVNGSDFIPVKALGNTSPFKSEGIILLQDKINFTDPVTIVIYYTHITRKGKRMGTLSKEYTLLDKYLIPEEKQSLIPEENQSFVPVQVTPANIERPQKAKGFGGKNSTIPLLILAAAVIAIGILFRFQKKSMKLIFRKLYYFTILALTVLVFIGALSIGIEKTLPLVLVSVITATLTDLGITYFKDKKIFFPSSAIIIGLIIGLLLAPALPLHIPAVASFLAMLSKHAIKINKKHIFNPASFGIAATLLLFPVTLRWWGGTSTISVAILGLFILYKLRKIHHIFTFFFTYVFLALIYTMITNQSFSFIASEVLSGAFLFFMFFMLTDPRTAPIKNKAKVLYGIVIAIATFMLFFATPNAFIYGLLIGNVFVPLLDKIIK